MKLLRNIITVLIVVATISVGVLFALQNKAPVPLDLLVYSFTPKSLALWVLCALALGGVFGIAVSSVMVLRLRAALSSANRKLKKANKQLEAQSKEPAKDDQSATAPMLSPPAK